MKKSRSTILTIGLLMGGGVVILTRKSPSAAAPGVSAGTDGSAMGAPLSAPPATSYRTSVGEEIVSAEPPPSRFEQIQAIKAALRPVIRAWERKHARYQQNAGPDGSSTLVVELPPADAGLVDALRSIAVEQAGHEAGAGEKMLETLLEQDFAELGGPRKIVALPRAGDGRWDRFEVFIPEPIQPTTRSMQSPHLEGGVETSNAQPWMMSYSFAMHGSEPPEELRHLLRFAEE